MKAIKFGIVGTGRWGSVHAEVYSTHPHAALHAVCDVDENRAREVATRFGARQVYADYRVMLRDSELDAVAVVTPDFAHCEAVIAAARAGKHVIVEKPLATLREDADRIAEAVRQSGVTLMVDFHNRWSPPLVVARENIEKGLLGDVVSATLRLNDTIYVPTQMLAWAAKSSVLWFLGSHAVDTLRFLLHDEVARVYAVARSGVLKSRGLDVPDIYQSILEFKGGAVATVENNWIVPNTNPSVNDFKVNVLGSKGMISLDLTHSQFIERFLENSSDRPAFLHDVQVYGRRVGFVYESIRHFVDCLAEGKPVQATLDDGVKVTKVILAILESADKQEPVSVRY